MILELACVITMLCCGNKIKNIKTEKNSIARRIKGPAENKHEDRDFNKIIAKIKENRARREAGEYIPNPMHDAMRTNLKRSLKPEVYAQWEKEGRLPGGH